MDLNSISWICAALALIGYYLNIIQNKLCFVIWIISNVGLIYINIASELYGQAFLWVAYTIMSIWGFISWSKKEKVNAIK